MKLLYALAQPRRSGIPPLEFYAINERPKSKNYRSIVRPVTVYGSEYWPTIKDNEWVVTVMETKMMHWTSDVPRFDHIRNENIRGPYWDALIVKKLRKRRLR